MFQGVQIIATPKANRQKDVFSGSQSFRLPTGFQEQETVIPPSSLPRIPQSVSRMPDERAPNRPIFTSIQVTPTRKSVPAFYQPERSLLGAGGVEHGTFPPSSPLHVRRSSAQLFTVVPESGIKKAPNPSIHYGIQETPVKKRSGTMLDPSVCGLTSNNKENVSKGGAKLIDAVASTNMGITKEESIYHSLGWDDADDIDDLA